MSLTKVRNLTDQEQEVDGILIPAHGEVSVEDITDFSDSAIFEVEKISKVVKEPEIVEPAEVPAEEGVEDADPQE